MEFQTSDKMHSSDQRPPPKHPRIKHPQSRLFSSHVIGSISKTLNTLDRLRHLNELLCFLPDRLITQTYVQIVLSYGKIALILTKNAPALFRFTFRRTWRWVQLTSCWWTSTYFCTWFCTFHQMLSKNLKIQEIKQGRNDKSWVHDNTIPECLFVLIIIVAFFSVSKPQDSFF